MWPLPPWAFVAAYLVATGCLLGLLFIAAARIDRARRRRAASDPLRATSLSVRDWIDAADWQPWPGPELDDQIIARQIRFARETRDELRTRYEERHR